MMDVHNLYSETTYYYDKWDTTYDNNSYDQYIRSAWSEKRDILCMYNSDYEIVWISYLLIQKFFHMKSL